VSVPRVRFQIWWLMVATAIMSLLLALLDGAVAAALVYMTIVVASAVACSPPKRRFVVASWVVALYPTVIPAYLYLAWLTAWCVLGHRARLHLDDPKTLGPIVHVPAAVFFFFDSGLVDCLEDFCMRIRHSDHRLVAAAVKWPPAIDPALRMDGGFHHVDEGLDAGS
jgi:hypothetical protein